MAEENNTATEEVVKSEGKWKKPQFSVWSPLVDKAIVIQQKGGIVIKGTLIGQRDMFFVLENATIHGRTMKASPTRLLVERTSVAHMHEECPVEALTPNEES